MLLNIEWQAFIIKFNKTLDMNINVDDIKN